MGFGTSGLLITAAVGYWVLERAEGHKQGLRRLGRWLGGAIIVVSLIGAVCRIACVSAAGCPWMGKAGCPMKPLPRAGAPALP